MELRAVKWSFDDGNVYPGFTDDTYWNGFLNVLVTPETRDKIVADLRAVLRPGDTDQEEGINDIAGLPIEGTHSVPLVSLANCYTTQEVE